MKPPRREKTDYELVRTDDFVKGVIEDIDYDLEHKFGFKGKDKNGKQVNTEKVGPGVRFKFTLEGCKFPHYSRWMWFSYGDQTNLFSKYIMSLVEGAEKDMEFDLDLLKGMKVKTLWKEKNNFQSIDTIRPLEGKILAGQPVIGARQEEPAEVAEDDKEEEISF